MSGICEVDMIESIKFAYGYNVRFQLIDQNRNILEREEKHTIIERFAK